MRLIFVSPLFFLAKPKKMEKKKKTQREEWDGKGRFVAIRNSNEAQSVEKQFIILRRSSYNPQKR